MQQGETRMADTNKLIENYIGKDIFPILSIIMVSNKQNYEPTISEITALFYEQAPTRHESPFIYALSSMNTLTPHHHNPFRETEKCSQNLIEYLKNVGWITVSANNRIHITRFGQSLIEGISEHTSNDDDNVSTIFQANDPFVYGKLLQALSGEKHELLVDPYFKFDYLYLFSQTNIRKFIIQDKVKNKDNPEIKKIQMGLCRLQEQGQNNYIFKIAESKDMHDRFLKDSDGKVYTIGTSINSIGKRTSMMIECPESLQKDAANHIQQLWQSATQIKPESPIKAETLEEQLNQ